MVVELPGEATAPGLGFGWTVGPIPGAEQFEPDDSRDREAAEARSAEDGLLDVDTCIIDARVDDANNKTVRASAHRASARLLRKIGSQFQEAALELEYRADLLERGISDKEQ